MKLKRSIFFQLLLILIVTGVLINVIVISCLRFVISPNPFLRGLAHRNVEHYTSYILKDIGNPPSIEKAKALSENLGLAIKMESPNGSWETEPGLPSIESLKPWRRHPGNMKWGKHHGRFYALAENGGAHFAFFGPDGPYFESRRELTVLLIALLTLVIAGSYFKLRHLFRPLRWLTEGVEKIGKGEWDHRVPVKHRDELGELAESFNRMTARLKEMIKAKEQLLLDVSHELRSPLTRMKVALELSNDEATKKHVNDDILEMEAMITDLLESARLDSPHGMMLKETVDVEALLSTLVKPGVRLDTTSGLTVQGDAARLKTVFKNLVDNATKYSEAKKSPIDITASKHGNEVVIVVADTGVGISEDEIAKLFEPFYRVDKSRAKQTGGFGLGLSLCRKIVEAHGGKISIESTLGKGTRVTVRLPV